MRYDVLAVGGDLTLLKIRTADEALAIGQRFLAIAETELGSRKRQGHKVAGTRRRDGRQSRQIIVLI